MRLIRSAIGRATERHGIAATGQSCAFAACGELINPTLLTCVRRLGRKARVAGTGNQGANRLALTKL
jgi:hypothetical protein